jgi:integrase/recombinase XerD
MSDHEHSSKIEDPAGAPRPGSTGGDMTLQVLVQTSLPQSASPYRLVQDRNSELDWANDFLDAQKMRGLSLCSLRAYAYDLLNLARWFQATSVSLSTLNHSMLRDYIRFQMDHQPQPAAQTVNHRISVTYCLYRFHYGREVPSAVHGCQPTYTRPATLARVRDRRTIRALRVKIPRHVVIPLTSAEVSQFWSSFRTYRDLALIALMLFNGLRSREALNLQLEDLRIPQAEVCVHGKGNRQRLLPLDSQTIKVLSNYLRVERPLTTSPSLFMVLKGPNRGKPLTPAGLRSLFRHHRQLTTVSKANPHRFRHTFGADMVRAGISLPALMRLMGHSQIHTTMLYVQLAPQDVWREFYRAIQTLNHPQLPEDL